MGSELLEGLAEAMAAGSCWLYPLAFAAGLVTSLNPCVFPMFAAVAGYVMAHGEGRLGRNMQMAGAFVAGLAAVYVMLGVVAGSFVGQLLGLSHRQWCVVVGVVCVVAGVFMAELVPFEVPSASLAHRYFRRLAGVPGALALGALMGLVATPCATPPLVVIVSCGAASGSALYGGTLLFFYSLGHALPGVIVAAVSGTVATLERLGAWAKGMRLGGAWLLIGLGVYLVAGG